MDESRQGLLQPERGARSSSEGSENDHESDLDVTEYLSSDALASPSDPQRKPFFLLRWRQACLPRRCVRSRYCLVALISSTVLIAVFAIAGGFAYKKVVVEPEYGLSPPWYPSPKGGTARSWATSYQKASEMVRRMTLAEKVNITTGTGWEMGLAVGTTGPAVNVGFPQLNLQDGPLGIRFADNATALPAGITVGATWNKQLMYLHGKVHAEEARGKGINAILGPCVGPLGRLPAGGRNWEGFGSDPYLQGVAGAQTILGIQSQGIMATIKHFIANEQEHFRQPWEWGLPNALSSNIDDRDLHEVYAWPFGDAVKAGVVSVMCSYNMVNNSYACGNSKLLNGILKDEMGFQGFVMSDWLAQRSGVSTALAGLDMTMPGDGLGWQNGQSLWGPELTRSVLNESVPVDRLNDMVTRIVAAWYQMGQDAPSFFDGDGPNFSSWTDKQMDKPFPGSPSPQTPVEVNKFVNVQGNHSIVARRVAAEGIVLLKNTDGYLPLGVDGVSSSQHHVVKSKHRSNSTAAGAAKVKIGIFGEDAGSGQGPNVCTDRGCNQGTLGSGWGSGAANFPYLVPPADALLAAFDKEKVDLQQQLINKPNPETYADMDVCIVFANADAGEGYISSGGIAGDRNDLLLQKGGDDMIYAVANGCGHGSGKVIVVVHAVGPVLVEKWIDLPNVKAVLHAHLPGQESGNAIADVLFGLVNPSGKLPYTIGRSLDDYGAGSKVMYMPNGVLPQQKLDGDIDYRYFDKNSISPRFEFGFGLSYTTFEVGNLTVHGLKPKSPLPSPRLSSAVSAPEYDNGIPDKKEGLFPSGFRKLAKYVYPYLDTVDDIVAGPYPYPKGYHDTQLLSGAGGDEGGNPDLWETYVTVTVDVRNTGSLSGQAVVQLYLAYPHNAADAAGVAFPVKVLRGFEKVQLDGSTTQSVIFSLTRRDLSYWDIHRQNWAMVTAGQYQFLVGQSSRDLPLKGSW